MEGEILFRYTLEQALEDGVLIPVIVDRIRLIPPQPIIVMTVSVAEAVDLDGLQRIWEAYCAWFATAHLLPEDDRLFTIQVDGQAVWVIEDEQSICVLFPEEY